VTRASPAEPPASILVVDDAPHNVTILSTVLQYHNYQVLTAESGEQALATLGTQRCDLLLLDVIMPGMDGFAVCRTLRAHPALRTLPVIMITASGEQEKVAALEAGADEFLQRPFDQTELIARIRTLLRVKRYHDTIEQQAAHLAQWNADLETRVQQQVAELERLGRLSRFLSPRLATLLVSAEGEALLESHRRQVAVLCCRLPGFTQFSERAEPEECVELLRMYHSVLGSVVERYEATVAALDEDTVKLLFNDPLPCDAPAEQAVQMALELRTAFAARFSAWSSREVVLGFAAAIDLGYATLGTVGLPGRAEYGVIGPVSRVAARLAECAEPAQILLTASARAAVMEDVETTPVGELHLAGFAHPFVGFAVDALRRVEAPPAAASHSLTQREWQVVDLIVKGYTNREIAEALVIAEGTAVKHVANVLAKLELRSRTQVAAWAVLQDKPPVG
jgi:DNA-binding NarL/FixJ family response regulator